MCNRACIEYGASVLRESEIAGQSVLEVGSMDVNGSLRAFVASLRPARYLGVDVQAGLGVDEVCEVGSLVRRYGSDSFDVVLTTEMLEHVRDWRDAIANLKTVVRPGGVLLLTTRSRGFPYHGYPFDFWRFEIDDMRQIFADFDIESLEMDPTAPGVFMKARKRGGTQLSLEGIRLFSVVTGRRADSVSNVAIRLYPFRAALNSWAVALVPRPLRPLLRRLRDSVRGF